MRLPFLSQRSRRVKFIGSGLSLCVGLSACGLLDDDVEETQGTENDEFERVRGDLPVVERRTRRVAVLRNGELMMVDFADPVVPKFEILETGRANTILAVDAAWSPGGERFAWGRQDLRGGAFSVWEAGSTSTFVSDPGLLAEALIVRPFWLGEDELLLSGLPNTGHYHSDLLGDVEFSSSELNPSIFIGKPEFGAWSPHANSGVEAFVFRDEAGELFFKRKGRDAIALPGADAVELSPSGRKAMVFSSQPELPVELTAESGVIYVFAVFNSPPPQWCGEQLCEGADTQVRTGVTGVKWSADETSVGVGVRWQSGTSGSITRVHLSAVDDLNWNFLDEKPQGDFSVSQGAEDRVWGFFPDGRVYYVMRGTQESQQAWALYDDEMHGPRNEVYRSEKALQEIYLNADGSALFVVTHSEIVGESVTAVKRGSVGKPVSHAQTLFTRERVQYLGNFLLPQPQGSAILSTAGDCVSPLEFGCRDEWAPIRETEPGNGYSVWDWDGKEFALISSGDGAARWSPDGEALLVSVPDGDSFRSSEQQVLYYVPFEQEQYHYPLTEMSGFSFLLPDSWR